MPLLAGLGEPRRPILALQLLDLRQPIRARHLIDTESGREVVRELLKEAQLAVSVSVLEHLTEAFDVVILVEARKPRPTGLRAGPLLGRRASPRVGAVQTGLVLEMDGVNPRRRRAGRGRLRVHALDSNAVAGLTQHNQDHLFLAELLALFVPVQGGQIQEQPQLVQRGGALVGEADGLEDGEVVVHRARQVVVDEQPSCDRHVLTGLRTAAEGLVVARVVRVGRLQRGLPDALQRVLQVGADDVLGAEVPAVKGAPLVAPLVLVVPPWVLPPVQHLLRHVETDVQRVRLRERVEGERHARVDLRTPQRPEFVLPPVTIDELRVRAQTTLERDHAPPLHVQHMHRPTRKARAGAPLQRVVLVHGGAQVEAMNLVVPLAQVGLLRHSSQGRGDVGPQVHVPRHEPGCVLDRAIKGHKQSLRRYPCGPVRPRRQPWPVWWEHTRRPRCELGDGVARPRAGAGGWHDPLCHTPRQRRTRRCARVAA
eukprot:scaffold114840_cov60-Phaeocystis_antarctica.AAC.1